MKKKKIISSLVVILIVIIVVVVVGVFYMPKNLTAPESQPTIKIQDKQITDNRKPFTIKITYPYILGLDDFNKKVLDIVNKEISDFKTNSIENDNAVKQTDPVDYAKYPRTYELYIGYDKGEIDNNIISTVLDVYNFEGGAHGAGYFIPLNYNLKTKSEIKLADLFPEQKDYLKKISDYCIKDLTTQITKSLGNTDGTWIQDGAGPTEDNYKFFLINKNNIVFYFPQYQVAYGAAGDFKVTMPR